MADAQTIPVTIRDETLSVFQAPIAVRHIIPDAPAGGDDRPTLVFLHEALGSIGQWKTFPQALCAATGLPGLVFDRIGYGGSGPLPAKRTPDYLREQGEDWVPAVLKAAGITQPPILFGHSDGGSIALYTAAAIPTRAVITEAAHVIVEDITLQGIRDFGKIWDSSPIRDKLARYHGDKTEAVYRAWHDTWQEPEFALFDMRPCLPNITAPALIIQGEDDQYGTAQQVTDIVSGIAKGTPPQTPPKPCFIPNCGHIPHLEAPQTILATTKAFLQETISLS